MVTIHSLTKVYSDNKPLRAAFFYAHLGSGGGFVVAT